MVAVEAPTDTVITSQDLQDLAIRLHNGRFTDQYNIQVLTWGNQVEFKITTGSGPGYGANPQPWTYNGK